MRERLRVTKRGRRSGWVAGAVSAIAVAVAVPLLAVVPVTPVAGSSGASARADGSCRDIGGAVPSTWNNETNQWEIQLVTCAEPDPETHVIRPVAGTSLPEWKTPEGTLIPGNRLPESFYDRYTPRITSPPQQSPGAVDPALVQKLLAYKRAQKADQDAGKKYVASFLNCTNGQQVNQNDIDAAKATGRLVPFADPCTLVGSTLPQAQTDARAAEVSRRVTERANSVPNGVDDCVAGAKDYAAGIAAVGQELVTQLTSTQLTLLTAEEAIRPAAADVREIVTNPLNYKAAAANPVRWLCEQLVSLVVDVGIAKFARGRPAATMAPADLLDDLCDIEAACVWGAGPGLPQPPDGAKYFDELIPGVDDKPARAYASIRQSTTDAADIAASNRIDPNVVQSVKTHIFSTKHTIYTGPGLKREGYFTPDHDIARLWPAAAKEGGLLGPDLAEFKALLAHEYVELRLMKEGLDYRSGAPEAWATGSNKPTPTAYGAHDLAPIPKVVADPFAHYDSFMGGRAKPAFVPAEDLSNLDELFLKILDEEERLGRR